MHLASVITKFSILDNTMAGTAIFTVLAVTLIAGANARAPQKIVNGIPASVGEFPYQVSLRANGQHICGGSIVNTRQVVTAAHCVTGPPPTEVVTGTISSSEGEVHIPVEIYYHEEYQRGVPTSPFDIAVITVADEIIFNEYQNKIAMPTAPAPANVMAIATGWGYISRSIPLPTPSLNKIGLQTISEEECQRIFGPKNQIHENQICTNNGPGYGVCAGDSGGPLVYNGHFIGIVSYGIPCGLGFPDVFTSVYHLMPWLNSVMAS